GRGAPAPQPLPQVSQPPQQSSWWCLRWNSLARGALQVSQQVGAGAGAQHTGLGAGAQQTGFGAGAQQVGAGAAQAVSQQPRWCLWNRPGSNFLRWWPQVSAHASQLEPQPPPQPLPVATTAGAGATAAAGGAAGAGSAPANQADVSMMNAAFT